MSKWYLITTEEFHGIQDLQTTEGMYIAERILPVGSIVPLEWKGRQRVEDLYLPMDAMREYTPTQEDWPILYALWPSLRPLDYQTPQLAAPSHAWYKITPPDARRNMSSVPFAYSALCDVEGVCKQGDLAHCGDIVPSAFFTGMNLAQMERLETVGLCATSWIDVHPPDYRAVYMKGFARPAIERVGLDPIRKLEMLEKFPAMQVSQKTISKLFSRKKN